MTNDDGGGEQASDGGDGGDRLRLDLAGIAVLALTLFVTLKAYGAAEFSLTTAAALLSDAPLSVLLATLVSYAYYVLPVLSLGLFTWACMTTARHTMDRAMLRLAALAAAVVTAALSPPRYLLLALGGLVLALVVARSARRRLGSPGLFVAGYFGLLAVLVFVLTMTRMWTPVEVVTVDEGASSSRFIAHVVSQDGQWTTLLTADSRRIVRVLSAEIAHRQICHHPSQPRGGRPLFYFLSRREYSSPNTTCDNICEEPRRSVPDPPTGLVERTTLCVS